MRIDSDGDRGGRALSDGLGLVLDSARAQAHVSCDAGWVQGRSRAIGRRVRMMSRTLGRRSGERKQHAPLTPSPSEPAANIPTAQSEHRFARTAAPSHECGCLAQPFIRGKQLAFAGKIVVWAKTAP